MNNIFKFPKLVKRDHRNHLHSTPKIGMYKKDMVSIDISIPRLTTIHKWN